ncbi:MAG: hypothetical protein ACE148_03740 [Vicinamibacterales bacterium]
MASRRTLLFLAAVLPCVPWGQAAPEAVDGARRTGPATTATETLPGTSPKQATWKPSGTSPGPGLGVAVRLPEGSRFDERLTRLFTPSRSPGFIYAVYVTGRPLDDCVQHFREIDSGGGRAAWKWRPRAAEPLAAFGGSGAYSRSRLARLFTGRPAMVARGSVRDASGAFVASVTLLSPYPDASFTRLETGTMMIVLSLDRTER